MPLDRSSTIFRLYLFGAPLWSESTKLVSIGFDYQTVEVRLSRLVFNIPEERSKYSASNSEVNNKFRCNLLTDFRIDSTRVLLIVLIMSSR